MKRLMRLKEVINVTGLSRSTIYEHGKKGLFPKGIPTGPRTTCWDSDAVEKWVAERIKNAATLTAERNAVGQRLLNSRTTKEDKS